MYDPFRSYSFTRVARLRRHASALNERSLFRGHMPLFVEDQQALRQQTGAVEDRAESGQLQPVAVAAQIALEWTFRIASIHRTSSGAVRAPCRVGTRLFADLLRPFAPRSRPCNVDFSCSTTRRILHARFGRK